MDDFISKVQTTRTFITFATIGGPIIIGVFVFIVLMSTPGLSGQQTENIVSPSFAPAPKANVNFYCQYDSRWTSLECRISKFGCDPTAIAIILASFGDKEWTPSAIALKNRIGCSDATTTNQTQNALRWVKTLGYKVAGLDQSEDDSGFLVSDSGKFNYRLAKKYIDSGYLIHAAAISTFRFDGSLTDPIIHRDGHSFVITDVNPSSETFTAYDPTFCFSDSEFVQRTMTKDDIGAREQEDSWYWAFPIKKEGQIAR